MSRFPGLIGPGLPGLVLIAVLAACGAPVSAPNEQTRTAAPTTAAPVTTAGTTGSAGADVHAAELATDLDVPWGLVPLADGSILVSERNSGKILRVDGSRRQTLTTLTDVRAG